MPKISELSFGQNNIFLITMGNLDHLKYLPASRLRLVCFMKNRGALKDFIEFKFYRKIGTLSEQQFSLFSGGAADKTAVLRVGDEILMVNNTDCSKMSLIYLKF